MSKPKRIAILGATSHIAQSLIVQFDEARKYKLTLFARNLPRISEFLKAQGCRECVLSDDFTKLSQGQFDVILNCIVNRDPADPSKGFDSTLFTTMEFFDNLVLDYLHKNTNCRYIHFSSGAVFGGNYDSPTTANTQAVFPVNGVTPADYYQAVKMYAEAKHRSLSDLNIIDIRIFAYFSRYLDLDSRFLLAEMISCVKQNKVFETDEIDIFRDYTHPRDFFQLVELCLEPAHINRALDLYSAKPVSKMELLRCFEKEFGLKYRVVENKVRNVKTGVKPVYYSNNRQTEIGYIPKYSAQESVLGETKFILD